ncbi:MAG: hypothetical protein WC764_03755 [Candidatus Paceibacterota bacterium]
MQSNKIITGVIVVFIIAALGFAIYYFVGGSSTGDVSIPGPSATDTPEMIASRDFLVVLGKFQNISLSTSTLDDRVFNSLIDESVTLPQEPLGRSNPFAPIGNEVGTTSIRR